MYPLGAGSSPVLSSCCLPGKWSEVCQVYHAVSACKKLCDSRESLFGPCIASIIDEYPLQGQASGTIDAPTEPWSALPWFVMNNLLLTSENSLCRPPQKLGLLRRILSCLPRLRTGASVYVLEEFTTRIDVEPLVESCRKIRRKPPLFLPQPLTFCKQISIFLICSASSVFVMRWGRRPTWKMAPRPRPEWLRGTLMKVCSVLSLRLVEGQRNESLS